MGGLLFGAVLGATMMMMMSPQARSEMIDTAGEQMNKMWKRRKHQMADMFPEGNS